MDRREFLRQVAAWSTVAAVVPLIRIPEAAAQTAPAAAAGAAPAAQSEVIVGKGKDYPAVVKSVIEKLGGMKAFVKPGNKVVIKPNIGWDRKPEQAANTNPDVVKTLVELALACDAKSVMVFDRSCDDNRRSYANSGIKAAVESLNDKRATCPYCDNARFIPIKIEKGKVVQEWNLYRDALEADVYINVPVPKHHGSAKLTLGLKNIMGLAGGNRGTLHQQQGEKLTDLHLVVKTHLTVMDATRILLRNGPQGGKLEDVKQLDTIAASTDIVAIDAWGVSLFEGMKAADIPIIAAAAQRGLGEIDLAKIRVTQV
jgi:uncharacterized protein (DUF362 family)